MKPLEDLCDNDERKFLYFGALTNLLAPINVHNPHWNYYHWTNLLSTLFYTVLCLTTMVTSMASETYLIIPKEIGTKPFIIINGVLLGCTLLSGAIFYAIFGIIYKQNLPRLLLWSCKSKKVDISLEMLKKEGVKWDAIDSNGDDAFDWAGT